MAASGDGIVFGCLEVVMPDKQHIYKEGAVLEALPATLFKVRLDEGREILAYLSGKMRRYFIRVLPGDRVRVEVSPYDETKGRIVQRLR